MTDAEVLADALRRVAQVTDAALAYLPVGQLLSELLGRVRSLLDADTAAVLLLDSSSTYLVATAARGLEEEVLQGVRIPLGQGFAGRIAAERRAVSIEHVDHSNVLNPILQQKSIRSLLGVPLIAAGSVIGVLHVGTVRTRRFSEADAELLQMAADRIAPMTRTHLNDLDHATAGALQRSLMPGALPQVAGLELSARYIPGDVAGLGGDWYDVFRLPSGRLGVVIGDVVGRGLQAAVVMGRLRSTLRAFALEEHDPAEVLRRLDSNVQHFEDGVMATVLYAIFDASMERIVLSSAGHLPPVVASPGVDTALVAVPVDLPVGVSVGPPRRNTMIDLPPGGLVFLYTDGLVERRGHLLDEGLQELTDAVALDEVENICATVLGRLIGDVPAIDDVAMLVVRRLPTQGVVPLDVILSATPRALGEVRSALRRWLVSADASRDATADLLVAAGEACSNVVEHAYGPGGGTLQVHAELDGQTAAVAVRDHGHWRAARGQGRGRGTTLMRHCSDDFEVVTGIAGTSVIFNIDLARERA